MKCCSNNADKCYCRTGINILVALVALLIVAGLVWAMKHYTAPPDLRTARAELRYKNLAEMRGVEKQALENYGWMDQSKGVVRLPLKRAMALTVEAWKNPEKARADLIDRVEKATAAPPAAPEQPSMFE